MLKALIESRYTGLILAVIGYCLAILSVVIFLNINNKAERSLWAICWFICCILSDHLLKKFNKQKYNSKI